MAERLMTRRNIAMICVFVDLDRGDVLRGLRAMDRQRRRRALLALLIHASRY